MEFCLNTKTGNIMADNKSIVYFEKRNGAVYPYIKRRGTQYFLNPLELAQFAKAGKWFIQHNNCDFGPEINQMCMGVK
jgi:hypothetical protein